MKARRLLSARHQGAFTLIEILLAAVAASLIMAAIYGLFQQAMRVRNSATARIRDSRVRLRAENTIRGDLRNALVSGGTLAAVFAGDSAGPDHTTSTTALPNGPSNSSIPGYLKFTTTTGRNDGSGLYGDVQQVEYYVGQDPDGSDPSAGVLRRYVSRDLLDQTNLTSDATQAATSDTPVLTRVQSFQVAFYDGANWQTSWNFSGLTDPITVHLAGSNAITASTATSATTAATQVTTGQATVPDAVRIDVQQAPLIAGGPLPPVLEITVPWTTQPFAAATPATASNAGATQ